MPLLAATCSCSKIWNWQDRSNYSVKTRPHTWSTWSVNSRSHWVTDVVKQPTGLMAACYGCKASCFSMTECRQQLWALKTGKSTAAPNCVVCHQQLKHLSKTFTEHTFRLPSGTVPWVEIHLLSMLWIADGKQLKQTSAASHEIWQKEYPMLLNRSWSWSNVVVLQSDLLKGPTVVAWGINFLALCSVPVVVVRTGLLWGLMQLSKRVVERQVYKQTGHADWTDGLRTQLVTRHLLYCVMKLCRHCFTPVVYYTLLSPFLPHTLCGWLNVPVTDLFHWCGGEGDWPAWPPVGV